MLWNNLTWLINIRDGQETASFWTTTCKDSWSVWNICLVVFRQHEKIGKAQAKQNLQELQLFGVHSCVCFNHKMFWSEFSALGREKAKTRKKAIKSHAMGILMWFTFLGSSFVKTVKTTININYLSISKYHIKFLFTWINQIILFPPAAYRRQIASSRSRLKRLARGDRSFYGRFTDTIAV